MTGLYALICFDRNLVYDVSNRETFEALPRWYSELETYVSESVVKIIVGNKVDKVSRSPLPPPLSSNERLFLQEFSRQVPTSEGEAFARRMNSLFIETSAKTAVGVSEAFKEVAEKIIDTPELWAPPTSQPASGSASGNRTRANDNSMPGSINLNSDEPQSQDGCAC